MVQLRISSSTTRRRISVVVFGMTAFMAMAFNIESMFRIQSDSSLYPPYYVPPEVFAEHAVSSSSTSNATAAAAADVTVAAVQPGAPAVLVLQGSSVSTKQKLSLAQSKDAAAMVLPKKSTNSVTYAIDITTNSNISCSLHATGNFTRFAPGLAPRALANYSVFLVGFQNQSPDSSLGKDDAAICEFRSSFSGVWTHFPHTMQQLYSCISWWNGHSSHPSVLAWSSKTHAELLR